MSKLVQKTGIEQVIRLAREVIYSTMTEEEKRGAHKILDAVEYGVEHLPLIDPIERALPKDDRSNVIDLIPGKDFKRVK